MTLVGKPQHDPEVFWRQINACRKDQTGTDKKETTKDGR